MSDKIDAKIIELLKTVTKQKEEVAEIEQNTKKKWVTNCSFPSVFGNTTHPINIQTQSEESLLGLLSDLMVRDEATTKASKILGVSSVSQTWGGYTIEQWIEDFQTRIAKLQLSTKKQKLAELESRLDKLVSPEQRRQLELEAIMGELGVSE